jgi:hypothetical protein
MRSHAIRFLCGFRRYALFAPASLRERGSKLIINVLGEVLRKNDHICGQANRRMGCLSERPMVGSWVGRSVVKVPRS